VIGVFGIGGLGAYAVQYAKLLGAGGPVVAVARNEEKLKVAKDYGADHIIAIEGKSSDDVGKELKKATGQDKFDAIIDCAGATEMMQLAFSRLGIGGHYADVGFIGDRIDIPLFPRVSGEQTFHGSFWGNNADLIEVMALAAEGKILHTIRTIAFNDINEHIDLMRDNKIVGRAVVTF
jgi:propanol-preferring alcohol dehydrogenase